MTAAEKTARLAYLAGQLTTIDLYARLWTVRATLPGEDSEECVRTALQHIHNYHEFLDSQDKLLRTEVTA